MRATRTGRRQATSYCVKCRRIRPFRDPPALERSNNLHWRVVGQCATCGTRMYWFIANGGSLARERGIPVESPLRVDPELIDRIILTMMKRPRKGSRPRHWEDVDAR